MLRTIVMHLLRTHRTQQALPEAVSTAGLHS